MLPLHELRCPRCDRLICKANSNGEIAGSFQCGKCKLQIEAPEPIEANAQLPPRAPRGHEEKESSSWQTPHHRE